MLNPVCIVLKQLSGASFRLVYSSIEINHWFLVLGQFAQFAPRFGHLRAAIFREQLVYGLFHQLFWLDSFLFGSAHNALFEDRR